MGLHARGVRCSTLTLRKVEDIKVVVRNRKSNGDRKYNSQKKRDKKTGNDLKNTKQREPQ